MIGPTKYTINMILAFGCLHVRLATGTEVDPGVMAAAYLSALEVFDRVLAVSDRHKAGDHSNHVQHDAN